MRIATLLLISTLALGWFAAPPLSAQSSSSAEQARYSEVHIALPERAALAEVAAHVGLDHVDIQKSAAGWVAVTVLNEAEIERLRGAGYAFEVTVPDLAAAVAARTGVPAASRGSGFGFGSMGGYYTYDEVVAKLDEMRADYPNLVSEKVSIGQTWEGRDLWVVRLSDNPDVDEPEPEVLYTALHHAREPQSMATVVYTMFWLLENYGTSPAATALLDNRELYFLPVLNPDGYVYNETTNPNGGGFWRKNRRVNGGGSRGVDLNRNYAYEWGYDNSSTSSNPSSDVYRGPAPFSEQETEALRQWLQTREIRAAFNYHSYSDVLLHPWGYDFNLFTPDHDLFTLASARLTRQNRYPYGTAANVLYPANGDSDDWMYGEQGEKAKIFAWTPEVGSFFDGFWPSQSRVVPLAGKNLNANLTLAWLTGAYPQAVASVIEEGREGGTGYLDPGEPGLAHVTLQNVGLEGAVGARARIVSTDPALPVTPGPWSAPFDLAVQAEIELPPLTFTVGEDATLGLQTGLVVELEVDGAVLTSPLAAFALGTPTVAFADALDDLDGWQPGGWGLTDTAASAPTAATDSPSGSYADDADTTLRLAAPFDLSGAEGPVLRFRARWAVEAGWDFVQVRASADGATWTPLAGRFTRLGSGSGVQTEGEPGYDGQQTTWVEEEVDLGAFAGEPEVLVEFRLRSDGGVTDDGFYVDDVELVTFRDGNTVSSEPEAGATSFALDAPFPNPVRDGATLTFALAEAGETTLDVYDTLGRRVERVVKGVRTAGRHTIRWDGRDAAGAPVASGLYVVELRSGPHRAAQRLTVLR